MFTTEAAQSPSSGLIIGTLSPAYHHHHHHNGFQRLKIPLGSFPELPFCLISHSGLHTPQQIAPLEA